MYVFVDIEEVMCSNHISPTKQAAYGRLFCCAEMA